MAIINYFEFETLLINKLKDLFSPNMIFNQVEINDLDNDDFTKFTVDDDKVGLIIRQAGFKTDKLQGKRTFKQQRIKFFWQLAVVCPSDLYATIGGDKVLDVMRRIMGTKLSKNYTEIEIVDDERDFNSPEFINDLVYIPMMIQTEAILQGEQI